MKKQLFSFLLLAGMVTMVSCNNENTTTATTTDTTGTNISGTSTTTGDYAAMSNEYREGSEQGRYLEPRTGQRVSITVDPRTGARYNAQTGEPVWRYVDSRNWYIYGWDGNDWSQSGQAEMRNNQLMYRADNGTWQTYEQRFSTTNEAEMNEQWKAKYGDTKIKVDGDEIKYKSGDVKYKKDGDGTKFKDGDTKIKTEDGETKVKN